MSQLSLSDVGVQYGSTVVLRGVTFTVGARERWGIVGRNGSGKTSLFRVLTGDQLPTTGQVARVPGLRMAVLDQHRDFSGATTVWDAVADAFREVIELERDLGQQADEMSRAGHEATEDQLGRYARDLERFEHLGGYRYSSQVDEVLEGLGFPAASARGKPLAHLSGGERGRVALARQLVVPADVLLLDEPTNHLDLETTEWLEEYLRNSRETQLIISHDRAFLDRVVDHVLHVEALGAVAYTGTYADFVRQRTERRVSQQRSFVRQQRSIDRESDYIARNIAGQNTRQAKGRRKRLERLPRLSPPPGDDATMAVRFDPGERGGEQVIVCERARLEVAGRVLLTDFTGWVRRGDVVGLIGPNGTGKSTMLRTIAGWVEPTRGMVRTGGGISAAIYSQDLGDVPRDRPIYDVIADLRPTWERGQVMGHLGRVQFSGDETKRNAGSLSGGELARVALAMMMLKRANLLVFDEPTNHLDVESIEELEDAIERFDGTVLLVSHDRELLRKLVTRVWELRDGVMTVFDGGFADWEERRAEAKAQRAAASIASSAAARDRQRVDARRLGKGERQKAATVKDVRKALERAELRIAQLEARERDLVAALADNALYEEPAGHGHVSALSEELGQVRTNLAGALVEWERATHAAEALPQGGTS